VHCVCLCWNLQIGSYWLIWTGTNFLLFHYPRYCYSTICSQSLLALLSFLWTLRYAIHFVRDFDLRLVLQKRLDSYWICKECLKRLWLLFFGRCTDGDKGIQIIILAPRCYMTVWKPIVLSRWGFWLLVSSLQEGCLLLSKLACCNLFLSKGKQFIKSLTTLWLCLVSNWGRDLVWNYVLNVDDNSDDML
jgi:hypothetical protein